MPWGEPGAQPAKYNPPQGCAGDAQNKITPPDRVTRRIQVFDTAGEFMRQFSIDVPVPPDARPAIGNKPAATTGTMAPAAPWAICITPAPNQFLFASDAFPGRIYNLTLKGKIPAFLANSR